MTRKRTVNKRPPEVREADRAAVLQLCDGKRTIDEIKSALGRSRWSQDVYADVLALRRMGHAAPVNVVPRAMRDGGGVVYRHFAADGTLLYVGCSANPLHRTAIHASQSPWFRQIARIEIAHFDSGHDAAAAEAHAIRTENPIHNVQGRPKQDSAA